MSLFDLVKSELIGEGISRIQSAVWKDTFNIEDLGDEPVGVTKAGAEVRDRLVIEATAIGLEKDLFIDAYTIDIDGTPNIVKTSLVDRDGTIKEYTSDGDLTARISITLLSGELNKYPEEDFRVLWAVLKHKGTIRMQSKLFDRLGVYDFVVEGKSLSAEEYERQTVSFTVIEDRSAEIDILNLNEF